MLNFIKKIHFPTRLSFLSPYDNPEISDSGDVKNRFIFLAPKYRSREYENAMEELTTFVYIGDNDHDDAPDGVTQLMMSITEKRLAEVSAVHNPFWGRR